MIRTKDVQFPNGKTYKLAGIPITQAREFFGAIRGATDEIDMLEAYVAEVRKSLLKSHSEAEVEEALADLTLADLGDENDSFLSEVHLALTGKRIEVKDARP